MVDDLAFLSVVETVAEKVVARVGRLGVQSAAD